MHLSELLASRPRPAAALFLALTRRCPLSCAHCSTASTSDAEQAEAGMYERFVATFEPADRPDFLLLTGGEPLLRPELVLRLVALAARAGSRSYLLTGGFFARTPRPAPAVARALAAVDHLAISLDAFHQAEVPLAGVFRAARDRLAAGRAVSFQVVGHDEDPDVAGAVAAVRAEFADQVPVLVGRLGAAGRARGWLAEPAPTPRTGAEPCTAAAWPVVGFDGTITACANQSVLDRDPLPPHLVLGHAAVDSWPAVRARCERDPLLAAIRTLGPRQPGAAPAGYCQSCWRLPATGTPAPSAALASQVLAAQLAAGAVGFARRHGNPAYAELVLLGRTP